MPRIARSYLVGKIFHITVKGIKGEYIFQSDESKKEYFKLLKDKLVGTNLNILAYCIMDNHAHILIMTKNIEEMSEYMKKVNTSFASFYNKTEAREGYVFKNRFFSQSIQDRKHLFSCIAYIHKNPVKASMAKRMQDYKFSSYNEYFKNKRGLIEKENIYNFFNNKNIEECMENFKQYHLKDELIEYEFEDEINYENLINDLKKYYNNEQIIKKLSSEFKLPIKKIAKLMNTTFYFVKKSINN